MDPANALTLSRLFATPFVIWLMYGQSASTRYGALILFVAAMLTDVFDGPLARRRGETVLGNYLDPVADKTLILCIFVTLAERGLLPLWMGLVLIGRELVVSAARDVAAVHGAVVGANWMGKTKTFLQVVTISFALFLLARADTVPPPDAFYVSAAYRLLWALGCATTALAVAFALIFFWWNRGFLRKRLDDEHRR